MGLLYVPLICGTLMEQEAQPLEKLGQLHVVMVEGKYKKGWSLSDKTRTALEQMLRRNQGSLHSGKPRTMATSHLQTATDWEKNRLTHKQETRIKIKGQWVELEAQPGKITKS